MKSIGEPRMSKAWKLKLLLFLTQHDVDSASVIRYLPDFEGPLPFHLETGYIGVGEGEKVQLFYYFIKSENNPKEDPLILWLTGGPACTALSALAFEIGPLTFKTEGYSEGLPSLISTSYSWTKVASIIFLDQPVGTGFSYSTSPLTHKPSDTDFEDCRNVHFLGNPSTDFDSDHNYKIPYAHGMGLISDELYEGLVRLLLHENECVSRIDEGFVLIDLCDLASPNPFSAHHVGSSNLRKLVQSDLSLPTFGCYMYRYLLATSWANDEDVRRALHVVKGSIGKWERCNWDLPYEKDIKTSVNSLAGFFRGPI